MTRSNEQGIALILALFMVLVLSTLTTSLMFVSQTETWSTQNYKMMSQARYAAESGIHKAANHIMFTYVPPGTNVADPLANYNMVASPCVMSGTVCTTVTTGGNPVVLSTDAGLQNYPIQAVRDAFAAAGQGTITVNDATVSYTSTARLVSMRTIINAYTLTPVTLQTWEITAKGSIGGARSAETELSTVLDRPTLPAYSYAAFATYNGCQALSFFGGGSTDSYNSTAPLVGGLPVTGNFGGNVGTNGNLDENGAPTVINGSLSTPRSGVGNCTANNVTAQTISGGGSVTEGLNQLAQPIELPDPDPIDPPPPTNLVDFGKNDGCPAGVPDCTVSANGATIHPTTPTVTLGNLNIGSQAEVHFGAGTYIINSLTMNANSKIIMDSGPVIFKIAGVGEAVPLTITGQGIVNNSYNPQNLQFVYGGTGEIKMAGGAETSALLYAPHAEGAFTGGSDWYGAVVLGKLKEGGGATIHYDRNLAKSALVAGNFMLNSFTWRKY